MQSQGHPLGEIIAMELACLNEGSQAELETKLRPRIQETYPDWGKGFYSKTDDQGRVNRIQFAAEDQSELSLIWSKGCVETILLDLNLYESLDTLFEQLETILNSNYSRLLAGLWVTIWLEPPEDDEEKHKQQPLNSLKVLFAEILTILTRTGAGTNLMQLRLNTRGETWRITGLDIAPLVSHFPNLQKLDVQGELGISELKNPTLKELVLTCEDISPEWQNILSAPGMQKLKRFELSASHPFKSMKGNISFLLENKAFQQLSELDITFDNFNDDCLKAFSKLSLPKLTYLRISLEAGDKMPYHWNLFQPFFQKASLPCLNHLKLSIKKYESEVLEELFSSPLMPQLEKLAVLGSFISDDSVLPFLENVVALLDVKSLEISGLEISDEMKERLFNVFGTRVLVLEDSLGF